MMRLLLCPTPRGQVWDWGSYRVARLTNKNTGCPIKCEFQVMNNYLCMSPVLHKTYLYKTLFMVYLKLNCNCAFYILSGSPRIECSCDWLSSHYLRQCCVALLKCLSRKSCKWQRLLEVKESKKSVKEWKSKVYILWFLPCLALAQNVWNGKLEKHINSIFLQFRLKDSYVSIE